MDKNDVLNRVKVELSKNGHVVSNLITNLLLIKNLGKHYKIVRESLHRSHTDSIYITFKKLLKEHPEILTRIAISQDFNITYEEFDNNIEYLANFYANFLKIEKGEKISVCAEPSIQGIINFFATNSLGAVQARIFNGSKEDTFLQNLIDFSSTTVLVDENNIDTLAKVASKTKVRNVIVVGECLSTQIENFKSLNPNINLVLWDDALKMGYNSPQHKNVEVNENDLAAILYTSGSSGEPKPILLPNRSFCRMVEIVKETTNEKVADGESVLGVVSHEYPYAANNSTTMILLLGKTLVLPSKNDPNNLNKIFDKEINKIQVIPSFNKKIEADLTSNIDISIQSREDLIKSMASIDYVVDGGEPYTKAEKINFLSLLSSFGYSPLMIDGFGFGELGSATALKFGLSDYFLLMNGMEAKVIDEKTGEEVPKGQNGILCLTGPTIALGYHNRTEATEKSFVKDKDGKVWFISDTYGSVHGLASRLIKLHGRLRECFITGDGKGSFVKVYSGKIEDVILSTGYVKDCIVVASDNGATPSAVAYISLKEGVDIDQDILMQIIKQKCESLNDFEQPTEYNFEDVIHRTPADKKDYEYYKSLRIQKVY